MLGVYVDKREWVTGMARGCVTFEDNKCASDTNIDIPDLRLINGTGDYCLCTGNLCNSAPQTSVGHLATSFVMISSLLALAAARLLTG